MPTLGRMAPAFTLDTDAGEPLALRDLRGQPVVLFFYPKDDTTTCTKEACAFRDLMPRFRTGGATILGISPDSVKSHRKFKVKYDLPYTLLADTDHAVAEQYGVWAEKSMYGHTYMGVERTTFVLDAKGAIRRIFEKVKVAGHVEAVAEAIDALSAPRKRGA